MWQELWSTGRVEAGHVLHCNRDIGKKRASATAIEEVAQHGQVDDQERKFIDVGHMCSNSIT